MGAKNAYGNQRLPHSDFVYLHNKAPPDVLFLF